MALDIKMTPDELRSAATTLEQKREEIIGLNGCHRLLAG